ncbi:hypothetical protein [Streptomyces sp. 2A115]
MVCTLALARTASERERRAAFADFLNHHRVTFGQPPKPLDVFPHS